MTNTKTARINGLIKHSYVDGVGVRYVIFFQGCPHHCEGCHNPETHDPAGGEEMEVAELISRIRKTKLLDGITLSGGEPFAQPLAVKELAEAAHQMGLTVWAYSGWTYEQLMSGAAGEDAISALKTVDVLVDGPFVLSRRSENCIWRGSTNQRVLDIPKSLKTNTPITLYR